MAGYGNRPSRGAGGTVSEQPPKPSAVKVGQFQVLSKMARQQAYRMRDRIARKEDTRAREVNSYGYGGTKPTSRSAVRRAQRGVNTLSRARLFQEQGILSGRSNTRGRNYRAPASRIY